MFEQSSFPFTMRGLRVGRLRVSSSRKQTVGESVITESVVNAGYYVDDVSVRNVGEFDLVFCSLASTDSLISLVIFADRYLRNKKTTILAGGFGVQNASLLDGLVDSVVWGRCEDIMEDVIDHAMTNRETLFQGKPCGGRGKRIRQTDLIRSRCFTEDFTGCPMRCSFCHYSHVREWNGREYWKRKRKEISGNECMFSDLLGLKKNPGRIRTAIDGWSEELRKKWGKNISNKNIVDSINHLGEFRGPTVVLLYNISNFPGETEEDYLEFVDNISIAAPRYPVIAIVHTTPFHASPSTPMAGCEVRPFPSFADLSAREIFAKKNLKVKHSFSNMGPHKHIIHTVAERASIGDLDIFKKMLAAPGKTSSERALFCLKNGALRFLQAGDWRGAVF